MARINSRHQVLPKPDLLPPDPQRHERTMQKPRLPPSNLPGPVLSKSSRRDRRSAGATSEATPGAIKPRGLETQRLSSRHRSARGAEKLSLVKRTMQRRRACMEYKSRHAKRSRPDVHGVFGRVTMGSLSLFRYKLSCFFCLHSLSRISPLIFFEIRLFAFLAYGGGFRLHVKRFSMEQSQRDILSRGDVNVAVLFRRH